VTHSGARPSPVDISLDDLALMTYTSGSTGLPKGAMLTHGNVLFKISSAARSYALRSDDVLIAVAPLYHIAGMSFGVCLPVFGGATTVLFYRFDPLAVAQALERYRVTWWYSVAPMNVALMQLPGARDMDWSALRLNPVTSFGIAYTEALAQQWRTFTPNCISSEAAYGLSETHTIDTTMPQDAIRWGTHGKPLPGNIVRIVDPQNDHELPAGEVGEITIRGPGNFKGYWNKPQATAATLRDGWVYTGDMGKVDADGYLTFLGRFKEMIKVSGYSVFPEEVEVILIKHPAVSQAAVIGKPDAEKGEVVCAFIVRKPGEELTPESLIIWARENMAAYKVPRDVRFVDALPTTGAGKVLRRLLNDLL
jgi:long-chain acyl-CoA synthetase